MEFARGSRIFSHGLALALGLCVLLLVLLRFHALDRAPPGFYLDEAAIAAQAMCVAENGRTADGSFSLFAPVPVAGYVTPLTLWVSAGWSRISGSSPADFRALAALMGLLSLIALVWGARAWRGGATSWGVVPWATAGLMVLASPWLFQLSRVYWDPIFAVAMWSLALALWCRWRQRPQSGTLFALGLFAGLAMLTYPPFRAGVPLALLVMLLPFRAWRGKQWLLLGSGVALGLLPLLELAGDSAFWLRSGHLAVWGQYHLGQVHGTLADVPGMALRNLALHLDPHFWLLHGDANRRHSTGFGGLVGPAEALGLVALIVLVLRRRLHPELRVLLLIPIGFLPAALTWQSLPHALRALMAAPAFLLAALIGMEWMRERFPRAAPTLFATLALGFFGFYAHDYFGRYADASGSWYEDEAITHWLQTREWNDPRQALAYQYWRMSVDGERCHADVVAAP